MMIHHKRLVIVMLLLFLFVHFPHSVFGFGELRCNAKEREALLRFKNGFIDEDECLWSSGTEEDKKECCEWKGIKCNNETDHVISIQLNGFVECYTRLRGNISSALLELSYLNNLDLTHMDFGHVEIPKFIGSLKGLRHLCLRNCKFSGVVPHQLGNLTNLRTLDLSYNFLSVIPDALGNLTNLRTLYLSGNYISVITSSANISANLRRIDLSFNNLSVIPNNFGHFSGLEHLDLSHNQITGTIPDLSALVSLKELHIRNNKLERLSTSLWQLSTLEILDAAFNSFEGTVSDADLSRLQNLKVLDLSYNSLVLNYTVDWIPLFQLIEIGLACCKMGPRFPAWLQTQTNISMLDLSCAGISDEMPKWLSNLSPRMDYLNLSHNHISGMVPHLLGITYISFNNFSGHLPAFDPYSLILLLNNNEFSGSISSICTITFGLFVLDLSNNQLSGELPNCRDNMAWLIMFNLNNNRLSGQIPHSIGSLTGLETLHLRDNYLSSRLPSTLKNCKMLRMIDVGGNKLRGNIPSWIGTHLKYLKFLIPGHNNFGGAIPPEICYLDKIRVLDLSRNSLSGIVPQCFNNFTSLIQKNNLTDDHALEYIFGYKDNDIIDSVLVQWKGQEAQYRRTMGLLKLIDLSSNKLVGNIPHEFSRMRELISLNLSRNYLSGNIISNIGKMEMLECLDLSGNRLSCEISIGLAKLNYLAVLDLSNNSLFGKIPSGTQLQGFNVSTYAGNTELCGPPLPTFPADVPKPPIAMTQDETDDSIVNIEFFISMVFGFILGFWGIVGTLVVRNSWRNAYFNFFNKIKDWFHMTITVYAKRLCYNLRAAAHT